MISVYSLLLISPLFSRLKLFSPCFLFPNIPDIFLTWGSVSHTGSDWVENLLILLKEPDLNVFDFLSDFCSFICFSSFSCFPCASSLSDYEPDPVVLHSLKHGFSSFVCVLMVSGFDAFGVCLGLLDLSHSKPFCLFCRPLLLSNLT